MAGRPNRKDVLNTLTEMQMGNDDLKQRVLELVEYYPKGKKGLQRGRPEKIIDDKLFESCLRAGLNIFQTATIFNVQVERISRHCKDRYEGKHYPDLLEKHRLIWKVKLDTEIYYRATVEKHWEALKMILVNKYGWSLKGTQDDDSQLMETVKQYITQENLKQAIMKDVFMAENQSIPSTDLSTQGPENQSTIDITEKVVENAANDPFTSGTNKDRESAS